MIKSLAQCCRIFIEFKILQHTAYIRGTRLYCLGDNETLKDKLQAVQNRAARTTAKSNFLYALRLPCISICMSQKLPRAEA